RDLAATSSNISTRTLKILADAGEVELRPRTEMHSFSFNGDSRAFIEQVARAYGVEVQFDDTFISRRGNFQLENVDFFVAMRIADQVSKSFWTPIDDTHFLMVADTTDNRRQYERMSLRTFYVPDLATAQQFNELTSLLRDFFEIRFILPNAAQNT